MQIFAKHTTTQHQGWRHVTLTGMQLANRFLDENGMYTYGLCRLNAKSAGEIEKEIVEPVADSVVNFAVIQAESVTGDPLKHFAFRNDLDFYVFTGMSGDKFKELEQRLSQLAIVPFLCLATAIAGVE